MNLDRGTDSNGRAEGSSGCGVAHIESRLRRAGRARIGAAVVKDREAELVRALAALAGRGVDDVEVAAILAQARGMTSERSNVIWRQLRLAPVTVSLRDYLAMTLRFVAQGSVA